jgi:hypothetical protein
LDINKLGFSDLQKLIDLGEVKPGDVINGCKIPELIKKSKVLEYCGVDRKDTANKPLPLLMPYEALVAYSNISDVGLKKYGERDSWRNSTNGVEVYANAAARHLFKLLQGEEVDSETGLPHYMAVVWNAAAVAWHYCHSRNVDRKV